MPCGSAVSNSRKWKNMFNILRKSISLYLTANVNFNLCTDADPVADTMAKTPLKLLISFKAIIISIILFTIATRSSKFSASTIFFSSHLVNYKRTILVLGMDILFRTYICRVLYHFQQVGTGGFFISLRPYRPDQFRRLYHSVKIEFEYRQLSGDFDGMQRQYPILVLGAVNVSLDGWRRIVESELYMSLVVVFHL